MEVVSAIDFLGAHESSVVGKPYSLKYDPPENFPLTNITSESYNQKIQDVRGNEHALTVAKNGFELMVIDPKLSYEDYDDKGKVESTYYKQVAEGVRDALGASRVQVFEHVLRKRHEQFPIATGEPYKYDQPTTRAHIDLTPAWGSAMAEHMNENKGIALPSTNYKFVNIWKPLRGPVRDWPLALCDPTTLDAADIEPSDLVYPAAVVENCLVRSNPRQKWYFLSNQKDTEAWVFAQSDSNEGGQIGVPHSSFLHPNSDHTDQPRESIEVRAIAYFD